MDSARRMLQIVRVAMLVSIGFYVAISVAMPSTATANQIILRAVSVLAVMLILAIIVARRLFVLRPEAALALQPSDGKALAQWRVGYLLTYTLSEAIALYGIVLHFLGFPFGQIVPFFLAGFVLLAFFRPRQPSNKLG